MDGPRLILPTHTETFSKQEYYQLRKKILTIRSTYLEQRENHMASRVHLAEERRLHALIPTEKMIEQPRRLKLLRPQ